MFANMKSITGCCLIYDQFGRTFSVVIIKILDDFYFRTGWAELIRECCIEVGTYVVFEIKPRSMLNMFTFKRNVDDQSGTMICVPVRNRHVRYLVSFNYLCF